MNPFRRRQFTAMQQGGGAAAFSPTDIAGLQLWLDASQIVGLNDGDAVATWADASGNANDATQGTASARPTYKTGILNGRPVVRCDGVDDRMTGNLTALGAGNYTVFVVSKCAVSTGYLTTLSLGGSVADSGLLLTTDGAINDGTWLIGRVLANFIDTTAPSITTVWHQLCVQRTAAGNANAFVNGDATTPASGNPGAQSITSGYTVGDYTGGGQLWNGDIAEVIVYDSDIGTTNRQLVEEYIRTKWGTPAAFSPTDITGLQLWLDASQIVGLNDGDAVATWSDLSGNALDFTQGTASKRPLFKTGVQNGRPGVLADGVDDIMQSASVDWSAYDKATIFCVYKNPIPTTDEIVYERSVNFNANIGGWILFNDATTVYNAVKTTSGSYSTVTNAVANGVVVTEIDLALANSTLTAELNGTAFSGRYYDGTGGNFGNYANFLFARGGGGVAPMFGYLLEMGVYMGEIGDSARAQLTTYLRNKWGY